MLLCTDKANMRVLVSEPTSPAAGGCFPPPMVWASTSGGPFSLSSPLPEADPSSDSSAPDTAEAKSKKAAPFAPPIVLILEDNPRDVFVIRYVLDSCGLDLDIRTVDDGAEALRYLREVDRDLSLPCPALILLDLNIPKVDGFEVLRFLREESRCDQTLVVVVTSSGTVPDRATADFLGVEGYFQKPTDLTAFMELAEVIKRVLQYSEKVGECSRSSAPC